MHFLIKSNRLQILLICLMCASTISLAQSNYDDFLGAGHDIGVKVRTSSNSLSSIGENTINGAGLDAKKIEASRFLFQAAFGGNQEEINSLSKTLDFEGWIENQFNQPTTLLLPKLWEVDARARELHRAQSNDDYFGPYSVHFQFAWWDNNYKAPDQLRQRIAFALSQIAVISSNSQIGDFGEGLASYYDILIRNAFGNYEDVLQEITIDPNMGFYLSHLNNPKSDEFGTRPDENYAREIMQLFSIGLYELHNDGSRKIDSNGDWIPTYDNKDIQELAKVFTGLKGGAWSKEAIEYGVDVDSRIYFSAGIYDISREVPLQMEEFQHEPGEKTIIGNYTIPSGQTGMEDIQQAVKHIFNHPNVGPFIGKRLIQQFVKSNPSRPYVNRVANAFNDNGAGVRGDMKAVIKAVLLDPEARDCSAMQDPKHGKLKEPLLRYTQLMHSVPSDSPDGYYWNNGYDFFDDTGQLVLGAPSVFNFYRTNYQPNKEFIAQDIVGPEFQIHNSQSAIGYMNQAHKWTDWGILFWDWYEASPDTDVAIDNYLAMAEDPETLINHFDVLMVHGRLSTETRETIKTAMLQIPNNWDDYQMRRVQICLYIIMISPDYVVLK